MAVVLRECEALPVADRAPLELPLPLARLPLPRALAEAQPDCEPLRLAGAEAEAQALSLRERLPLGVPERQHVTVGVAPRLIEAMEEEESAGDPERDGDGDAETQNDTEGEPLALRDAIGEVLAEVEVATERDVHGEPLALPVMERVWVGLPLKDAEAEVERDAHEKVARWVVEALPVDDREAPPSGGEALARPLDVGLVDTEALSEREDDRAVVRDRNGLSELDPHEETVLERDVEMQVVGDWERDAVAEPLCEV